MTAESTWTLPEKYTEDLLDENGTKMSKRYVLLLKLRLRYPVLLKRSQHCVLLTLHPIVCSEFKKRQKAVLKEKEKAEKLVSFYSLACALRAKAF